MPSWTSAAVWIALALAVFGVSLSAVASPVGAGPRVSAASVENTVRPEVGIGAVSLGESRRAVEHVLGKGRATYCSYCRAYRDDALTLVVAFDQHARAAQIITSSPAVTLYRHHLALGYDRFRARTRNTPLRRWTWDYCSGHLLAHGRHLNAGPSTLGQWSRQHFDQIAVSTERVGGCGLASR